MDSSYVSCVSAVSSVIVLSTVYFIWKRKEHFSKFERCGIKGPKPSLIWGNLLEILRSSHTQCQKKWHQRYGAVVGYYFGYQPVLLIADGKVLKQILIRDFQEFADRGGLLGRSDGKFPALTELRGQRWKKVRSILTPSFTSSKLKQLSPGVACIVDDFIHNVDKGHAMEKEFDMQELYKGLTLDAICKSALGVDFSVQKDVANSKLLNQLKQVFVLNFGYLAYFLACFPSLRRIAGGALSRLRRKLGNDGEDPVAALLVKCGDIIKSRREDPTTRRMDLLQLMMEAQESESESCDTGLAAGDDAEQHEAERNESSGGTGCPMSAKKGLSDIEITTNAFVILGAGYETTSSALAFITRMLLRFPEVQEELRAELLLATDNGTVFDFERLQKCHFMESVIQEVLRMHPPVHSFVSRFAYEEKKIGSLVIPANVDVMASTSALHYDSDVFPNPTEFVPSRFLPENKTPAMAWAWHPFGIGPRNCIGMRFAQMEIRLTLAKLLTKYRLSSASEPRGETEIAVVVKPALQSIKDPLMVATELIQR